jgi:uracil-DNA glycosylase family 4
MNWTAEQRVMLREMGVPVFWPEAQDAPVAAPVAAAHAASAAEHSPAGEGHVVGELPPHAAQAHAQPQPVASAPAAPRSTGLRPLADVLPSSAPRQAQEAELGQRPSGIDTMDWPALRTAVSGCEACGLCKSRTQAVFGVGHPQAHWMIVGEAPGEQEDKQGEPFVGKSGQLLDRMLHAVGLGRQDGPPEQQVFIANALKCRPPANRNPLPQEMAQCEPYLLRQVALVQPKLILAMGRFAVQSLLQSSEPIGKLRGRVHAYAGVPLIVTYHPAYLLRSPADKAMAWADLCLAREVLAQQAKA